MSCGHTVAVGEVIGLENKGLSGGAEQVDQRQFSFCCRLLEGKQDPDTDCASCADRL